MADTNPPTLRCIQRNWYVNNHSTSILLLIVIVEVPGISTFQDLLNNIFAPLFEVTRDPQSHPNLHLFLQQVSSSSLNITTSHSLLNR
jgi:hypothetical protein